MTTKNPDDLPLTRGQAKDLARDLINLLAAVRSGTAFVDEQWRQRERQLLAIIDRKPVETPQPFMPTYATDEQLAAQQAAVAEERSGERLRQKTFGR